MLLLGMSGGLDSTVAAILLKKEFKKIVGATLNFYDKNKYYYRISKNKSQIDAIYSSDKLGIPYYTFDYKNEFKETVISYFINSYQNAITPNPCVYCNYVMKFKKLIEIADQLSIGKVATGHYARMFYKNERYYISVAKDEYKDQSYFLWKLTQNQLSRIVFPLGNLTKAEVKDIAYNQGFNIVADKQESYNICFIEGKNYRAFFKSNQFEIRTGKIIYAKELKTIGKHDGIINYTIGQKISIDKQQYFVIGINAIKNTIFVGSRDELYYKKIELSDVNFQKFSDIEKIHAKAKIRYKDKLRDCYFYKFHDKYIVEFHSSIYAPAVGQSVVVYDDKDIIAGGIISCLSNY